MTHFHVFVGHDAVAELPVVRKIRTKDVGHALAQGAEDFWAMPSHLAFLGLIYPACGLFLAYVTSQQNALQLVFPLASGFALLGPIAAVGLYEMSRRRELGLDTSWKYAFNVLRSPSIPSIAALGLLLLAIFLAWIAAAQLLYVSLFGPTPPASAGGFLHDIFGASRGWTLIVAGCLIGFCFAVVAFTISVVSFPLLLDRDIGVAAALVTSVRTVWENPVPMALWGLIVAAGLVIGSLPLFIGLAAVVPILGHATWRLYRILVVRNPAQEHPMDWLAQPFGRTPEERVAPHSFLFPWPKK